MPSSKIYFTEYRYLPKEYLFNSDSFEVGRFFTYEEIFKRYTDLDNHIRLRTVDVARIFVDMRNPDKSVYNPELADQVMGTYALCEPSVNYDNLKLDIGDVIISCPTDGRDVWYTVRRKPDTFQLSNP